MAAEVNFVMVPISTGAPDLMRRLLEEFESISRIKVNVRLIDWLEQRTVMVDTAVHGRGADVFLVAVPQTSDLIGMNALRPFTPAEVAELGGAESFLAASLRSGMRPGENQIWAIPWLVDTRVLFYWRDLLESAGLDGATAFKTCGQFDESFAILKQHGFDVPFAPPYENYMVMHTISSWIWENGGDLFSLDGKEVTFHYPDAMAGVRAYMEMILRMPAGVTSSEQQDHFHARVNPVTINGGWMGVDADPRLACVVPPGGAYLGGTNLVVFKHTRQVGPALELVRFLCRPETQMRMAFAHGFLPSRMSVLTDPEQQQHPIRGDQIKAALAGRTYPCVPMIGLVEDRLSQELARLQREIHASGLTAEQAVRNALVPLGKRLNLALGSLES